MTLRVTFDLEESDLQHFRLIMNEARKTAANFRPEELVASAKQLLEQVQVVRVPLFVSERLEQLAVMIQMLEDHEWRLPTAESARVLNALTYFRDPDDLIPDHVPGLGFLDDAIMIELAVRELRHEMDAYRDFCDFRNRMAPRSSVKAKTTDITRDQWLAERRKELQSRMRRRRKKNGGEAGSQPLQLL